MAWLGSCTRHTGWFKPLEARSLARRSGRPDAAELLPQGTLLVEARLSPEERPQTLLAFDRCFPWPGTFSLRVLPGGSVVFVEEQGGEANSAVLPCPYRERTDIVRVSYSWDAPARIGRLAIERPEPDSLHMVNIKAARPMVLNDIRETMLNPNLREIDSGVSQIALSNRIEPVGPRPGLTGHTLIMTQMGERPISKIARGDLVRTYEGELVPVLQVVRQVMPAAGGYHPVRLRAGYFGLNRDLVLAPDQRIIMRGSDVEYMFNQEAVSVPARYLMNDVSAIRAEGPQTVAYYQLVLPGHEVMMASGCPVESLYIGRIRRKPQELRASILAGVDRALLPEHGHPAWPVLKPFEAITLATTRAA